MFTFNWLCQVGSNSTISLPLAYFTVVLNWLTQCILLTSVSNALTNIYKCQGGSPVKHFHSYKLNNKHTVNISCCSNSLTVSTKYDRYTFPFQYTIFTSAQEIDLWDFIHKHIIYSGSFPWGKSSKTISNTHCILVWLIIAYLAHS